MGKSFNRPSGRREGPAVLLGFLLLVLSGPLAVQGAEAPDGPQATGDDGPPPVSSPWRSSQFDVPVERLRAEVLALAKAEGLPLQNSEGPPGAFLTGLIEFDEKRFGKDVSVPPPRATPKYPYFQMIEMSSGRYGLEGHFIPVSPSQTRLEMRAILEIQAMDKKNNHMRWVPRYSNGKVEEDFFSRLRLALLAPGSPPSPSR